MTQPDNVEQQYCFPFVTCFFIVAAFLFQAFVSRDVRAWLEYDWAGQIVLLLVHPVVHLDARHLLLNIFFGFFFIGVLVESWMVLLSRRVRYGIFLFGYLVSLVLCFLVWQFKLFEGGILVGSSGIIYAVAVFPLFYYIRFWNRVRSNLFGGIGPVMIGFVLAFILLNPLLEFAQAGAFVLSLSTRIHLAAMIPSLIVLVLNPRICGGEAA